MAHAIPQDALPHVSDISPTPRDRLMNAATRLFCKYGINATGIDAIVNEAGTAKTTLYKIFGSKSDLVEAVLESEGKIWRGWFISSIERAKTPRAKIDSIFPALKKWFNEDDYYGCVFINAVGEHPKDETRLRAITMTHKSFVLAHVEELARAAGASKPAFLAHRDLDGRSDRGGHGDARPDSRRCCRQGSGRASRRGMRAAGEKAAEQADAVVFPPRQGKYFSGLGA